MIQTSNFISFINDNNDSLVQKRINYDKNKIISIKSNLNSNESNENNIQFNSLHSSYLGNIKTNNNLSSNFYRDNNSKFNKKSEIIYLGEKEENHFSKKSENNVFINNGTFMDANLNNKNKLNLNFNLQIDQKNNYLSDLEQNNNKFYSYRKNKKEKETFNENNYNNIKSRNTKNKTSENNSIRNGNIIDNDSKQKIMNNSSLSLLKDNNYSKNLNTYSSNKIFQKKELLPLNNDKKHSIYSPYNPFSNNDTIFKAVYKNKNNKSTNDLINSNINNKKSISNKYNLKNYIFDREKIKLNTSLIRPNNKSHEKNKNYNKTNYEIFNQNKRKKTVSEDFIDDNNSQISLPKKLKENYKKNKFLGNKINKEKIRQDYDGYLKKKKNDTQNSLNMLYTSKNRTKGSFDFEKDGMLATETFINYLCLCGINKNNGIRKMCNFRKRLLSEEYLYIIHLNLLVFKKKFGCKTMLDLKSLIEELYYD